MVVGVLPIKNISNFIQQNIVFCLATVGAVLSAFIVPPSAAYISYLDFRVLGLLFALMAVVKGFERAGVFVLLTRHLFRLLHTTRQLAGAMIFACFFASMWITNDVSLITFVPFAMVAFRQVGQEAQLIKVVVLQTVAANLGSMCTPVGNPQNLYLFMVSGMGVREFVLLLLPYTVLSFLLLVLFLVWFPKTDLGSLPEKQTQKNSGKTLPLPLLLGLFLLCMLTVGNVVDYRVTFFAVLILCGLYDRVLLKQLDYVLLLTFIVFFIFIGNLKHIPIVYDFFTRQTVGHEFLVSLLASQVISNVPAAILLSGFTKNYAGLMLGTDIGGLGTLIASMASLISYKLYVAEYGNPGKYLWTFTWVNGVFLVVLVGAWGALG